MNEDLPIAVSGTRRALRELADGTVRVQIDIDPRFRSAFFQLFSEIDCGVAMTPLASRQPQPAKPAHEPGAAKTDAIVAKPLAIVEETGTASRAKFPKGLCGLAVQWCGDDHFCAWLSLTNPSEWAEAVAECGKKARDDELAKYVICSICEVDSRKLLDTEPDAGDVFRHRILDPYSAQRKADGVDGVGDGKPF